MNPLLRIGALVASDLLLRAHLPPEALDQPAAVVTPKGPGGGRVVACTEAAVRLGIHRDQTRVQALARSERLQLADLDPTRTRAAQDRLLHAVASVSPVVEDGLAVARPDPRLPGAGVVRFDARGLGLLHPRPEDLLGAAVRAAASAGFPRARVALAGGPGLAALLAAAGRASPPPGGDRTALASLPLEALQAPEAPPLPEDALAQLRLMGVTTVGGLAALPASAVEARFGPAGLGLQRLARGQDPRPLRPWAPEAALCLTQVLEHPAGRLDALTHLLAPLLEALLERLSHAGLTLARLELGWRLPRRRIRRRIEVCDPLVTPASLLALVRLDLETRPLGGPVHEVALRADRTLPRPTGQGDLFQRARAGRGLERAVARLRGRLGTRQVGVVVLDDRHRPEAAFHLEEDLPRLPEAEAATPPPPGVALRLHAPPRPIQVEVDPEGRPVRVEAKRALAAGPFPLSGEWWAEGYDRRYYEVEAGEALLWLFQDGRDGRWYLQGTFD